MLTRLVIVLDSQERDALQAMAERDMRGLKDQARYVLRETLDRCGLLGHVSNEPTQEVEMEARDGQPGR